MRKRCLTTLLCLTLCIAFSGCGKEQKETDNKENKGTLLEAKEINVADGITVKFSEFEVDSSVDDSSIHITLEDDASQADHQNVTVEENIITISEAGTYVLKGSLSDGKIVVNADKTEKVKLVLDNVDVACSEGAPLVVESADKTVLTLAEGSVNTFTDATASADDASVNACICSKDDLAINGTGTLIVNGNVNNGIGSKNDLEIISGTIQVQAVKNGLKGNDSVSVLTGTIGITCGKDGIKSDNDTETGKGFVYIENAAVTVNAGDDGIQAVNAIVYKSGSYEVTCTGKKTNCDVLEDISETVKVTEK